MEEMGKYRRYLESFHSRDTVYVDVITDKLSIQQLIQNTLGVNTSFINWAIRY